MLGLPCILVLLSSSPSLGADSPWDAPRRGSWVQTGRARNNDVTLAAKRTDKITIVIGPGEKSNVQQAAKFLESDLEKITGVDAVISSTPPNSGAWIDVKTQPQTPPQWEAYTVRTASNKLEIRGSNPRGTAFGIYELSERLGVDPLYRWTGYEPEKHLPLVVKATDFHQDPPDVKFRGLFHDDEDIFPRPKRKLANIEGAEAPSNNGAVSLDDYKRFFETALRLRMNMVAPWVRVNKYFAVQKLASDWGLYYTSHHYDVLLSDPYHLNRKQDETPYTPAKPTLAEVRGVKPIWDFINNREDLIKFWKGGVDENRSLDCIWPVGLRNGSEDSGYKWPAGYTEDQKLATYSEAIKVQTELVKAQIPPYRERFFHFTMYTEMLPFYLTGKLTVPDDVIIVWPDNNDGYMRALPESLGTHQHGVYYHLMYLGGNITKQTHQVVPPTRVETEFRNIFKAGATTFVLTNVSDQREVVLGTRMISDILWDGHDIFKQPEAAKRYLRWWSQEYFGMPEVAGLYQDYFNIIPETTLFGIGAQKCMGALATINIKLEGKPFSPLLPDTLPMLQRQKALHMALEPRLRAAAKAISSKPQKRFFFENLELAAAIDRLNILAAIPLCEAVMETDKDKIIAKCNEALPYLNQLELLLDLADRPPFEGWYGYSWISDRNTDLHLPKVELMKVLEKYGK